MFDLRLKKLARLWSRLAADRRGNVAMTFALAIVPIVGAVGTAVDYSRANAARTAMQAAIDTTALIISKDAANLSGSDLNTKANAIFSSLFTYPNVTGITLSASYNVTSGLSNVVVNANGIIDTNFLRALGTNNIPFATTSTATWGSTRLRVALALDNTGSMASNGKMDALKSASKNLIDQLKATAKNPGDVYVSIVPFSKDVNVGPSNYLANWLDWNEWDQDNGSWSPCTAWNWKGKCTAGTWVANNHNTWNGCVTDRSHPYDRDDTTPTIAQPNTLFVPEQYGSCPVELMPLSYDWTALKNKIDDMTPTGNTNTTIGLEWGWHSLTQNLPLSAPAEDVNFQYKKVMIFLTDGENTQNRWNDSSAQIDAHMKIACTNAKNANIEIYTILVMEGNESLLKDCATNAEHYFKITAANQLVAVFNQIGTNLSKLRISK